MAFHFSLEAILRLRRGQERMERLKLEAIASEQAQAKRQLEIMTEQFLASRRRFQEQIGQETSGSELQFEDARSDRVEAAQRALKMRISELEQRRLKQVQAYLKARQGREILENLRARKFELYRQMLSRREQQELDDLFLMRQDLSRDE
jgi:flagellar export protein FliJ